MANVVSRLPLAGGLVDGDSNGDHRESEAKPSSRAVVDVIEDDAYVVYVIWDDKDVFGAKPDAKDC